MTEASDPNGDKVSSDFISGYLRQSWQRHIGNHRTQLSNTHEENPRLRNGRQYKRNDVYW